MENTSNSNSPSTSSSNISSSSINEKGENPASSSPQLTSNLSSSSIPRGSSSSLLSPFTSKSALVSPPNQIQPPIGNIIKEMGLLYVSFFSANGFLEYQARQFVQEFEGKRGDSDFKLLRSCTQHLVDITQNISNAQKILDQHPPTIYKNTKQCCIRIFEQVAKEKEFFDQREILRKEREAREISEKNAFMESENAIRKEIDKVTHSSQLKPEQKNTTKE